MYMCHDAKKWSSQQWEDEKPKSSQDDRLMYVVRVIVVGFDCHRCTENWEERMIKGKKSRKRWKTVIEKKTQLCNLQYQIELERSWDKRILIECENSITQVLHL